METFMDMVIFGHGLSPLYSSSPLVVSSSLATADAARAPSRFPSRATPLLLLSGNLVFSFVAFNSEMFIFGLNLNKCKIYLSELVELSLIWI